MVPSPLWASESSADPSHLNPSMKLLFASLALFTSTSFAVSEELGKIEAQALVEALWKEHGEKVRKERAEEMKGKSIRIGDHTMRFEARKFGKKPPEGWALFLSFHGGGGAPARVNDSQWQNQVRLGDGYQPKNAIYLVPRAPTDTWNLWHQSHIDLFIDRLIENFVIFEDVNPNAVYLMGYSAGGDGVYQLAPRMADRLAGAAMMAGHPNEASPLGLRNIAFAIHVGERDGGYNRNSVAVEWNTKLEKLREDDQGGYETQFQVHKGKGHWMDLQDKVAVPWLQKFTRTPLPDRVVWFQDDVLHDRFYWLAVPKETAEKGQKVVASIEGQTVSIEETDNVNQLLLRLNDEMLDLDVPVSILAPDGSSLFQGNVHRSKGIAKRTFDERRDRALTFPSEILIDLESKTAKQAEQDS